MGQQMNYTCDGHNADGSPCGKSLNDADLLADATLRRIIVAGGTLYKANATDDGLDAKNYGGTVFCGQDHAVGYLTAALGAF